MLWVLARLDQARTALADAQFLHEHSRSPQSTVNRACYSMFYATLALLQTIDRTPAKHAGVLSLFDTEFVLKNVFPKELSRNLHWAFDARQASDYRAIPCISLEQGSLALERAATFLAAIEHYLHAGGWC